jgi:hypothetical protein
MATASIDGVRIFYELNGSGDVPLVLVVESARSGCVRAGRMSTSRPRSSVDRSAEVLAGLQVGPLVLAAALFV